MCYLFLLSTFISNKHIEIVEYNVSVIVINIKEATLTNEPTQDHTCTLERSKHTI